MGLGDYAAVLGVWLIAIAAPGPDVVLVLRQTVRGGRSAGVAAAAGIAIGCLAWIALAMIGAHALVEADDRVLGTLQLLGGAYLVGLGVMGLRAALRPGGAHEFELADLEPTPSQARDDDAVDAAGGDHTALIRRSFGLGLLTNLSNPKALLFFGTVFSVLIPQAADRIDRVVVATLLFIVAACWFSGLAMLTSSDKVGAALGRHAARLDAIAAVAFIALGLVSVVSGVTGVR